MTWKGDDRFSKFRTGLLLGLLRLYLLLYVSPGEKADS